MHLQTNLVVITPEEDEELRLAEIPAAIRGAGFLPAEMNLRARGSYLVRREEVAFRIRGWADAMPVRTRPPVPEGETTLRAGVDYSGPHIVLDPLQ